MATTKEYKEYILEMLDSLDNVRLRPMMGEYLLYYQNVLCGGIYDDRLLVKIVKSNMKYNMPKAIPYDGGKEMFLVSAVDERETLNEIIIDTYNDLKK